MDESKSTHFEWDISAPIARREVQNQIKTKGERGREERTRKKERKNKAKKLDA